MVWLDELIWRQFPLLNLLILGVATIMLVLFLPRGIVGTLLRRQAAMAPLHTVGAPWNS